MKTRNTIALTLIAAGLCTFNVLAAETTATEDAKSGRPEARERQEESPDMIAEETRPKEPTFHAADITQDNLVNIDDLLAVLEAWGSYPRNRPNSADIFPADADDFEVNYDDMLFVIQNWGTSF